MQILVAWRLDFEILPAEECDESAHRWEPATWIISALELDVRYSDYPRIADQSTLSCEALARSCERYYPSMRPPHRRTIWLRKIFGDQLVLVAAECVPRTDVKGQILTLACLLCFIVQFIKLKGKNFFFAFFVQTPERSNIGIASKALFQFMLADSCPSSLRESWVLVHILSRSEQSRFLVLYYIFWTALGIGIPVRSPNCSESGAARKRIHQNGPTKLRYKLIFCFL